MLKPTDPTKALHVLYVEKHPEDARFFQTLLSSSLNSFKVKTVSTVDEAFRAASIEPYHVTVLSSNVCGASISEVVSKVALEMSETAVVLFLSPGEDSNLLECKSLNVQGCVVKTSMDEVFLKFLLRQAYELKVSASERVAAEGVCRRVMDAVSGCIMVVNAKGEVLAFNSAAEHLLNLKKEDLTNKQLRHILLGAHQEDRSFASGLAFVTQSLQDGQRRTAGRVAIFNKQGQNVWVSCVFEPIVSPGKKVEGGVLVFQSVSEGAKAEDKLKDAIQEQLRNEQRLVEALSELRKLNQQLHETQNQLIQAEKLQSVGRLAAGVAHEVKNPLAILLQGVEYLQQAMSKEEKESQEVLNDMIDAVQRADMVIKGLLDFAAPAEPEMLEEDLEDVLDESLQLLKHLLVTHKIEVQKDFSALSGKVVMDRNRMQQVFVNIFSNAIHAMRENGVLCVSARREQDSLSRVIVEVSDSGTGIPVELLDKVFDPFVTTRRGRGGTGLGLSVVKGIMEMHQGEIRIENRSEGGVKVTLKF